MVFGKNTVFGENMVFATIMKPTTKTAAATNIAVFYVFLQTKLNHFCEFWYWCYYLHYLGGLDVYRKQDFCLMSCKIMNTFILKKK